MRKKFIALMTALMLLLSGMPFTSNPSLAATVMADPAVTPPANTDNATSMFTYAAALIKANGGSLFDEQIETDGGYTINLNGAWEYIDMGVDATEMTNMDQDPYDSEGKITKNGPHDNMHAEDYATVQNSEKWKGAYVPFDLHSYSFLTNSMRVWYRTNIDVKDKGDKSYVLDFDGTCWITTVLVNGVEAGSKKGTGMPWKLDITKYLNSNINEITIGVKAPRYAIDPKGTSATSGTKGSVNEYWVNYKKLSDYVYTTERARANDPTKPVITWDRGNNSQLGSLKWYAPITPSSKGDTTGDQFGIIGDLKLDVSNGSVYASDVYVKTTDVTNANYKENSGNGKLSADITIINNGAAKNVDVQVVAVEKEEADKAREEKTEPKIAKDFGTKQVTANPGETRYALDKQTWDNVKLWWPAVEKEKAFMYELRVIIKDAGNISDVTVQPFGFREITLDGKFFRINGLRRNFWNNLNSLTAYTDTGAADPEGAIKRFKKENNRFERYGSDLGLKKLLGGIAPNEQLDWLDENGLPVRYSTMIDGMGANFYMFDSTTQKVNTTMFMNFRDHIIDAISNYRNHPSIMVYSLENELLYINAALIYKSAIKEIEAACKEYMTKPADELDPLKPSMYDGGGAFMDNSNEIYCPHYQEDTEITINSKSLTDFPAPASQGLWTYDDKRPYAAGEVSYFSGTPPQHAWIGGTDAANGQSGATKAYDIYLRSMMSRFRWNDAAIVCPWFGSSSAPKTQVVMDDIAAIRETYTTTLYDNATKNLKVKVFNDTFNSDNVVFKWSLTLKGSDAPASQGEESLQIEPGFGKVVTIQVKTPAIEDERVNAVLKLETAQGELTWSDEQNMSVIKKVSNVSVNKKVLVYAANSSKPSIPAKYKTKAQKNKYKKTAKYKNALAKHKALKKTDKNLINQLKSWGLKPTKLKRSISATGYKTTAKTVMYKKSSLKGKKVKTIKKGKLVTYSGKKGKAAKIKVGGKTGYIRKKDVKKTTYKQGMTPSNYTKFIKSKNAILVVARDAIKSTMGLGDSGALVQFAKKGGRIVCLEQSDDTKMFVSENDTKNQLPMKLNTFYSSRDYLKANYVFGQGFDRVMLHGLQQSDLSNWNFNTSDVKAKTTQTTEALWAIPETGKTWANAGVKGGEGLEASALLELPVGKGAVMATQFKVNDRLLIEPAAQKILSNMLLAADKYSLPNSTVGYMTSTPAELKTAINQSNTVTKEVASVESGLDIEQTPIFLLEANDANLTALLSFKDTKLKDYNENGGWLMLWNLKPDCIDKYNELMGTQHIIRPYRRELTRAIEDWTTIGLSTSDFTLYTEYFIAPWANKRDVSKNTFSYCIDATDNLAPFHDFEKDGFGNEHTANRDGNKANLANDLYNSDFWMYINQTWHDRPGAAMINLWNNDTKDEQYGADVWTFKFTGLGNTAKSYKIKNVEITNNVNYNSYKDFRISVGNNQVNGDESSSKNAAKVIKELPDANEPTNFEFNDEGNTVKLRAISLRDKKASNPMCGIDNVIITREQPEWITTSNCQALASNGGLVKYTRGEGGIIMNNIQLTPTELVDYSDPDSPTDNKEPKANLKPKYKVFAVMLQNMGAKLK